MSSGDSHRSMSRADVLQQQVSEIDRYMSKLLRSNDESAAQHVHVLRDKRHELLRELDAERRTDVLQQRTNTTPVTSRPRGRGSRGELDHGILQDVHIDHHPDKNYRGADDENATHTRTGKNQEVMVDDKRLLERFDVDGAHAPHRTKKRPPDDSDYDKLRSTRLEGRSVEAICNERLARLALVGLHSNRENSRRKDVCASTAILAQEIRPPPGGLSGRPRRSSTSSKRDYLLSSLQKMPYSQIVHRMWNDKGKGWTDVLMTLDEDDCKRQHIPITDVFICALDRLYREGTGGLDAARVQASLEALLRCIRIAFALIGKSEKLEVKKIVRLSEYHGCLPETVLHPIREAFGFKARSQADFPNNTNPSSVSWASTRSQHSSSSAHAKGPTSSPREGRSAREVPPRISPRNSAEYAPGNASSISRDDLELNQNPSTRRSRHADSGSGFNFAGDAATRPQRRRPSPRGHGQRARHRREVERFKHPDSSASGYRSASSEHGDAFGNISRRRPSQIPVSSTEADNGPTSVSAASRRTTASIVETGCVYDANSVSHRPRRDFTRVGTTARNKYEEYFSEGEIDEVNSANRRSRRDFSREATASRDKYDEYCPSDGEPNQYPNANGARRNCSSRGEIDEYPNAHRARKQVIETQSGSDIDDSDEESRYTRKRSKKATLSEQSLERAKAQVLNHSSGESSNEENLSRRRTTRKSRHQGRSHRKSRASKSSKREHRNRKHKVLPSEPESGESDLNEDSSSDDDHKREKHGTKVKKQRSGEGRKLKKKSRRKTSSSKIVSSNLSLESRAKKKHLKQKQLLGEQFGVERHDRPEKGSKARRKFQRDRAESSSDSSRSPSPTTRRKRSSKKKHPEADHDSTLGDGEVVNKAVRKRGRGRVSESNRDMSTRSRKDRRSKPKARQKKVCDALQSSSVESCEDDDDSTSEDGDSADKAVQKRRRRRVPEASSGDKTRSRTNRRSKVKARRKKIREVLQSSSSEGDEDEEHESAPPRRRRKRRAPVRAKRFSSSEGTDNDMTEDDSDLGEVPSKSRRKCSRREQKTATQNIRKDNTHGKAMAQRRKRTGKCMSTRVDSSTSGDESEQDFASKSAKTSRRNATESAKENVNNSVTKATQQRNVYITNIPAQFHDGDLRRALEREEFGAIDSARTDVGKSYGLVAFSKYEDAAMCVAVLNGVKRFGGRTLTVRFAHRQYESICGRYNTIGGCKYGSECKLRHACMNCMEVGHRDRNCPKICRFHEAGRCKFGTHCPVRHS